jgi:hypothetical protein
MPAPVTLKVDIGISTLINKLDEIHERRTKRTEEFFKDIHDDLESVAAIIDGLDNLFVFLALGYSDRRLVSDSEQRDDHVKATKDYLNGRNIVPRLIRLQGFITQAANNQRLRSKSGAPEKLSTVAEQIQTYLQSINYEGESGTGYQELTELTQMAGEKNQGNQGAPQRNHGKPAIDNEKVDKIIAYADKALRNRSYALSASLQRLIGEAQGLIA